MDTNRAHRVRVPQLAVKNSLLTFSHYPPGAERRVRGIASNLLQIMVVTTPRPFSEIVNLSTISVLTPERAAGIMRAFVGLRRNLTPEVPQSRIVKEVAICP